MDESESSDPNFSSSLKYSHINAMDAMPMQSPFVIVTPSSVINSKNYHKSTQIELNKSIDYETADNYNLKQNLLRMSKNNEIADNNNNNNDTSDMEVNDGITDLRHQSLSHLLKNNIELIKNQTIDLKPMTNNSDSISSTHQYAIDGNCSTDNVINCNCSNCCDDEDKNNNSSIATDQMDRYAMQTVNTLRMDNKRHGGSLDHMLTDDANISEMDSPKTTSIHYAQQQQIQSCKRAEELDGEDVSFHSGFLFVQAK